MLEAGWDPVVGSGTCTTTMKVQFDAPILDPPMSFLHVGPKGCVTLKLPKFSEIFCKAFLETLEMGGTCSKPHG